TGAPTIWLNSNGTIPASSATLANPGPSWHIVGTGDFNGDGDADIVWQNTNGTPGIWLMNGTTVISEGPLPNPGATWQVKADGPIPSDQMSSGSLQPALHLSMPDTASAVSQASPPPGINNSTPPPDGFR